MSIVLKIRSSHDSRRRTGFRQLLEPVLEVLRGGSLSLSFAKENSIMGNGVTALSTWRETSDPQVSPGASAPFWLLQPQQVDLMGNQKMVHIIRELLHPELEANLVKRCRRRLVKSLQPVDAIVDTLRGVGVLSAANLEAIKVHANQREKQRILVDQVLRKGNKAQDAFFLALAWSNPFVLQDLDRWALKDQVCCQSGNR